MDDEEEKDSQTAANSEIRFMTLELMKLAQKSGKTFSQMATEYMDNTCLLQEMIIGGEGNAKSPLKRGSVSKEK